MVTNDELRETGLSNYTPSQPHSPTSIGAAAAIRPEARNLKARVYECVAKAGVHGMTDQEMQRSLSMDPSTQRPRRIDLVHEGKVLDSGKRRDTSSGRKAVVWVTLDAWKTMCGAAGSMEIP